MEIEQLLTNLAFPAAIAAFALWNSYKHEEFLQDTLKSMIEDNTNALDELKHAVSEIAINVSRETPE